MESNTHYLVQLEYPVEHQHRIENTVLNGNKRENHVHAFIGSDYLVSSQFEAWKLLKNEFVYYSKLGVKYCCMPNCAVIFKHYFIFCYRYFPIQEIHVLDIEQDFKIVCKVEDYYKVHTELLSHGNRILVYRNQEGISVFEFREENPVSLGM